MHDLALIYGIDHPEVLKVSQKLDVLLNDYLRQKSLATDILNSKKPD